MIRALKYQLKYFGQFVATMLLIIVFFIMINVVTTTNNNFEYIFMKTSIMTFMILFIMPITILMSYYSNYFQIALNYGATRKNYFLSLEIIKIMYMIFAVIVYVITMYVKKIYMGVNLEYLSYFNNILLIIVSSITLCSLGELMGIIIQRFGRIALWIVSISVGIMCGGGGAVFGMSISMNHNNLIEKIGSVFKNIFNIPIYVVVIVLMVNLILTAISYTLSKKLVSR